MTGRIVDIISVYLLRTGASTGLTAITLSHGEPFIFNFNENLQFSAS